MNLLAADIGGTKSWLCLAKIDDSGKQNILFERIYLSQDFNNAISLIERFLQDASAQVLEISRMCLALPGVVTEQSAQLTNLGWQLDTSELKSFFSIMTAISRSFLYKNFKVFPSR